MIKFSLFALVFVSALGMSARADKLLFSCHGTDGDDYRLSSLDTGDGSAAAVVRVVNGVDSVAQSGTYQAAGQLDSFFVEVTNNNVTVLLLAYDPDLRLMTGYVQLTAEEPKISVRCPLPSN